MNLQSDLVGQFTAEAAIDLKSGSCTARYEPTQDLLREFPKTFNLFSISNSSGFVGELI